MSIPLPSALVRAPVTWTLGHADTTGPLKAARGFVRFEASAIAVAYSDRTVLPSPVETPFIGGVMDPVDLIVNDPDVWNWKVTVKAGGVTWDPFHINVPAEGTNLASASITPGKGPVRVLKGDQGIQGIQGERGPEGPYGGTEVTDPQVASYVLDQSTETALALDQAFESTPRRVVHGDVAGFSRPPGPRLVEWFGSVEPSQMVDGDTLWLFEPPFSAVYDFAATDLSGWTAWWGSPGSWLVKPVAGATGGNALTSAAAAVGRRAFTVDASNSQDQEVVARLWSQYGSAYNGIAGGVAVRVSNEAAGEAENYIASIFNNTVDLSRTVNGQWQSVATKAFEVPAESWFWLRLRAVGSRIQVRSWRDSDTEPDVWHIDVTDNAVPGPGVAGAFASAAHEQRWDVLGVGVDGEIAPKGVA